jgi:ABC-type nitrate/sulfonate/bicarbonate transport system ATPase subunit
VAGRRKQVAPVSTLAVNIKRKAYGRGEAGRLAIAGLKLQIREGELLCLLGPSGAGKTTTLNIIAGLDTEFEGEVRFSDAKAHRLSYLFQEPRLLPWRTMIENVALPLNGRPEAQRIAASWLDRVGLKGCHNLYPTQASAGMQRRAAIARAFAYGPTILLMDEPFVSLDEKSAAELRSLFAGLWRAESVTTLFVTHNVAEAAELATRVLIFSACPATIAADIEVPARNCSASVQETEQILRLALKNVGAAGFSVSGRNNPEPEPLGTGQSGAASGA